VILNIVYLGQLIKAYRVFMLVYNGLLSAANMASPKYNSKTSFCLYKANIFYRIFEQTTVGKASVSVSPAVSWQSFGNVLPLHFTLSFSPSKAK
jgi:hypothetical protein